MTWRTKTPSEKFEGCCADGHEGPKEIGVGPEFLAWLTDPKLNARARFLILAVMART